MYQPDEHEMARRPSSTRSPSDRSTDSNRVPANEKVLVQIPELPSESAADIEKTLKRGLEARQVSVRLPFV